MSVCSSIYLSTILLQALPLFTNNDYVISNTLKIAENYWNKSTASIRFETKGASSSSSIVPDFPFSSLFIHGDSQTTFSGLVPILQSSDSQTHLIVQQLLLFIVFSSCYQRQTLLRALKRLTCLYSTQLFILILLLFFNYYRKKRFWWNNVKRLQEHLTNTKQNSTSATQQNQQSIYQIQTAVELSESGKLRVNSSVFS